MNIFGKIFRHSGALVFFATLGGRFVAAAGAAAFFWWLQKSGLSDLSENAAVIISWASVAAYIGTLGFAPLSLRYLTRTANQLRSRETIHLRNFTHLIGFVAAILSTFVIIWITHSRLHATALTTFSIFVTIFLGTARAVQNDILRANGYLRRVAWFEFGHVLTLALVGQSVTMKFIPITLESVVNWVAISSTIIYVAQHLPLTSSTNFSPKQQHILPTLRYRHLIFWLRIGSASIVSGLLGSASRDIFIILYSIAQPGSNIAGMSLLLRIWEGLSIPLVAAYSDLSSSIISRDGFVRDGALRILVQRVRFTTIATSALAAAASVMWATHPAILNLAVPGLGISLLMVIVSRAFMATFGIPSLLLSVFGAARRALIIAVIQNALLVTLMIAFWGHLTVFSAVLLWCVTYVFRTAAEARLLAVAEGIRSDVLSVPATLQAQGSL